jgi:hypothetical protein
MRRYRPCQFQYSNVKLWYVSIRFVLSCKTVQRSMGLLTFCVVDVPGYHDSMFCRQDEWFISMLDPDDSFNIQNDQWIDSFFKFGSK